MNRSYFLIPLCILITGMPAFGQVTLKECQEKARNNFPLIRQCDLIELSKEYTLSNAGKAYLPQLDVTLIGGFIEGLPSFSPPGSESSSSNFNAISVIQLNQMIWDGGITKARKGIAEASAEIEKADLEVALFALEDRVNNLFFGVLMIDEQLKQLEILKSTLLRSRRRIEIAIENGTAFKSDIDELDVEVIHTDQRSEELSTNRSAYVNVLAAMTGEAIEGDAEFIRPEIEDAFLTVENNRPELVLFQNRENLINAQSQIDKAMLFPKIGILGFGTFIQPGADFGTSKLNNIFIGGISLNWSLGNLYTNSTNKKLSEVNLQKVHVQRETFLFNTNLELTQTQYDLEKHKKLIDQDREIVALKSSIKKAYDVKYENGICTMSELLDRTNEESVARQQLIVHEIRYLMKAYQYLNITGNQ
ncbi:MAG: TolC family protein [Cytophagales bacterium]|nr:TolC family protein [Cytophagales bacterium]